MEKKIYQLTKYSLKFKLGCDFPLHSATNIQYNVCFCVVYLFFFGVQLKALIQGATVLLNVVLLLSTDAFRVLHHLLLDITKQTANKQSAESILCIFTRTQKEIKDYITSLWFCAPTQQWASHVEVHLSHTALELWGDKKQGIAKEINRHTHFFFYVIKGLCIMSSFSVKYNLTLFLLSFWFLVYKYKLQNHCI